MAKTYLVYGMLAIALVLVSGCCGSTGPSSSSSSSFCSMGTYGNACTNFCEKSAGTQFDEGSNCFSGCMDAVRQQGLGDATACCTESINQQCQKTCDSQLSNMVASYGSVMDNAEKQDFLYGCVAECTGPYEQLGISLDSCSVFNSEYMLNLIN